MNWSCSNGVRTVTFSAYDEPWKGPADGSDSEAFFGIWKADGTASDRGHYTLNGVTRSTALGNESAATKGPYDSRFFPAASFLRRSSA